MKKSQKETTVKGKPRC